MWDRGAWRQLCASRAVSSSTMNHRFFQQETPKHGLWITVLLVSALFLINKYSWVKHCAQPFKHHVSSEIRDSSPVRTATWNTMLQRYSSPVQARSLSSSGVSTFKTKNFLFPTSHAVCFIFRYSGVLDLQTPGFGVNFTNFSDYTPNTSMLLVEHKHSEQNLLYALYWNTIRKRLLKDTIPRVLFLRFSLFLP